MVDWSSPAEIAHDAGNVVLLIVELTIVTNIPQSPSIGSYTLFLVCICACNIYRKSGNLLRLSNVKLGMGGVTGF